MVAFSLWLPRWPTDLVRRWRRLDRRASVVLTRSIHQVETVAAVCERAERAGVVVGMTAAHARALVKVRSTVIEPIDDERTRNALRKLAAWMVRLVPVVATDGADGLLCDVTGCERLYRGLAPLARRMLERVRGLGLAARLGIAQTFGGAWALARYHERPGVIEDLGTLRASLADLPVEALRLEPSAAQGLARVGVVRVGELLALPRAAIADRYGHGTLLRIDQALGDAIETIKPVRSRPAVRAEEVFDGPTDRLDAIMLAVRTVLARVAEQLVTRESGCRKLELRLDRSDLEPLRIVSRTAKPTRDAKHLWSLLVPKLESAHLGFGVQGVRLTVGVLARLKHEQADAWATKRVGSAETEAVARLVDTVNARFGTGRVVRMAPHASYLPERAVRLVPVLELDEPEPDPDTVLAGVDRPTLLYDRPRPVEVVLLLPEGPFASIRLREGSRRVVAALGPERIGPEWWRSAERAPAHAPRDYYRLLVDDGRVLWVYRERGGGAGWFVHGVWA